MSSSLPLSLPYPAGVVSRVSCLLCCVPRMDLDLQEKSLGGLCRRFVQLFLVGNHVVSVQEAAEKLSDAADVRNRIRDRMRIRIGLAWLPETCWFRIALQGFGTSRCLPFT